MIREIRACPDPRDPRKSASYLIRGDPRNPRLSLFDPARSALSSSVLFDPRDPRNPRFYLIRVDPRNPRPLSDPCNPRLIFARSAQSAFLLIRKIREIRVSYLIREIRAIRVPL